VGAEVIGFAQLFSCGNGGLSYVNCHMLESLLVVKVSLHTAIFLIFIHDESFFSPLAILEYIFVPILST
jgi:hypothetical protein